MRRSGLVVDALVRAARAQAIRGDDAAATALLAAAATVARRRHTGWFASPLIESELTGIGRRLAAWPQTTATTADSSDRVLHVMTRAYATGGHTRLVERWIESEHAAVSSVALTEGAAQDAPVGLATVVERSGGAVHSLAGSAIERARQLHRLVHHHQRVVLSIHENDVVPTIALADRSHRPPVLLVNHAEHVFWVGASIADVVVNLRPASTDLAIRRRGISRSRCVEIPLPVTRRVRERPPADARRALGISTNAKVLLTVGWRYKYTPFAGDELSRVLAPILDQPDVELVAVGPRDDDELWSAARDRFGGRVHARGRQEDIQPFLDAAEVFVDSYPIASLTAALEAAVFGLPVVGLAPRDARWPRILCEDDPALAAETFDDPRAYRRRITALLRDRRERDRRSQSLQELAVRIHGPDAWTSGMSRVHEAAGTAARQRFAGPRKPSLGTAGPEDEILATHIADCEDRLMRPELRLTGLEVEDDDHFGAALSRIDALLLRPAPPSSDEYAEALHLARDLTGFALDNRGISTR